MKSSKNVLTVLLFGISALCSTAQAMELSSDFYHDKHEMSFLMQAIEKVKHDQSEESEEELKIVEQKNSKIKAINNFSCSRENCIFAASHQNRIDKHREMHRLQDILPHITMYRCNICDYLINKSREMDDHKNSHIDRKEYYCQACDAWFKSAKGKNRHERESEKHKQNSKKGRPRLALTNG